MMKRLLFGLAVTLFGSQAFAAHVNITNIGFAFSPALITINLGDTVIFNLSAMHNARQVSFSTYSSNDTVALPGGFEAPYGASNYIFVPTTLGDIYYVCVPHVATNQMKGRIVVSQLGVEDNKSFTMQILQSFGEENIKLVVGGANTGDVKVEMMNLSGQVVRSMNIHLDTEGTNTNIFVGDLPKGVYMVRWSYGTINRARKIIL